MIVRSGWNSEYARKKYDVELGEEDLARILIAGQVPMEAQATLTLADAHNLLWYSAEIVARQTLANFDPSLKQRLVEEARGLNAKRAALLKKVGDEWEATRASEQGRRETLEDQIADIQKAKAEVRQELGLEPLREPPGANDPETQ